MITVENVHRYGAVFLHDVAMKVTEFHQLTPAREYADGLAMELGQVLVKVGHGALDINRILD